MGDKIANVLCYNSRVDNPNPIWNSENILMHNLAHMVTHMAIVVFVTRFIYYILRPFNQPHIVAELLAGFLLNINVDKMFSESLIISSETLAHVGLVYYVFITGLEMNLDIVLEARKKAQSIAIVGTFIPMALGAGVYYFVGNVYKGDDDKAWSPNIEGYFLWALALSVTSFPITAHILADLKILYTGLGREALTAATISDFNNWAMFVLLTPFATNGPKGSYSVICTIIFSMFCYFVLRPPLVWLLAHKTTHQNEWDNYQLSFVIMGVFACATVTEMVGTNSIVGALLFGLILPRGDFTEMLIEKSDDICSGYLTPLFFFSIGNRTSILGVIRGTKLLYSLVFMLLLGSTKIVSTIIVTHFYGMSMRDGMALGLLMNTKGILSLIILTTGFDKKMFSKEIFTIMAYSILVMTAIVSPIINAMYKPKRRYEQNKLRTIENLKGDSEIRVMACVHNARQATGMINNILEACNGTNVSPLHVFALHLVELKGRSTALMVAHMDQSSSHHSGPQAFIQSDVNNSDNISNVFEEYALNNNKNTIVETLVAKSHYATIHKDIYNLALEKQASLVLLPFHKQASGEGTLEITNIAFKDVNQNVMQDAPCSVGIFVDRGHASSSSSLSSSLFRTTKIHILMLFIGGPDDREALAIAWRMSKNPGTRLSMVRIVLCGKAAEVDTISVANINNEVRHGLLSAILDGGKEKELDEEYVGSFRLKAVNNEDSITYAQREVHTGDAIPQLLNELDKGEYDLYILGQGKGRNSLVLSNLLEWTDCPELGVIGDMLASNSFGSSSSILVVQQYGFGGMDMKTNCNNNTHDSSNSNNFDLESLSPKKE